MKGKRIKKFVYIIAILMLSLTGCGKSGTIKWTGSVKPLQQWYEIVSSELVELNSLQDYVDAFVACHDEAVNYGLAYGITAVLCEELELCEVTTDFSDEELAEFFSNEENLYLLDLTLPMFENYYFEEDITKYVKAAAVSFANRLDEEEMLESAYQYCVEPDSEILTAWKNDWLKAIGVEEIYEPCAEVFFLRNNHKRLGEYPYVLSDTEANWYFSPEDVKEYGYKAFMKEYLAVEELMKSDFPEARALFETYLPEDIPKVDICTAFYKEGEEGGEYFPWRNFIALYYDWETGKDVLLHEYVHYLTMGVTEMVSSGGAFAEGIAEEAAVWGCENRLKVAKLENMPEAEQMKGTAFWDDKKERVTMERVTYITAQNYYAGVLSGSSYFAVAQYTKERPANIETIGLLSYQEMASLTHYLIEIYGRDAVYEAYYDLESFESFIGKDFLELYDEWAEWNLEQCHNWGISFVYE